jgi:hypothetical protein
MVVNKLGRKQTGHIGLTGAATDHEALRERIGPTMTNRDSAAGVDQSRRSFCCVAPPMAVKRWGFHVSIFTTMNTDGRSSIALQPNRRTRNEHYHR